MLHYELRFAFQATGAPCLFQHCLNNLRDLHAPVFDGTQVDCELYGWKKRTRPAVIMDGFLFNGEFDILTIRLGELGSLVDYFIVLEAAMTFSQAPKKMYFHEAFPEFNHFWGSQIVHSVVDSLPNNTAPIFSY